TEGGRLKLANLQRMVHSALVVHKLIPAFQIFNSEAEGIASFAPAGGTGSTVQ
ncbi:MAG: hypothetical protein HXY20_00405, partial [Acidobacteria bacterium]|nr:hypothetical protein [Acidobacteriota bacterium]